MKIGWMKNLHPNYGWIFFNGNENFEKMKTQKIQINKIKIYTVVGLDWCQTCSLCL
jgi:hypothetical protein